ncbi:unnamed protein product [Lota lota]
MALHCGKSGEQRDCLSAIKVLCVDFSPVELLITLEDGSHDAFLISTAWPPSSTLWVRGKRAAGPGRSHST